MFSVFVSLVVDFMLKRIALLSRATKYTLELFATPCGINCSMVLYNTLAERLYSVVASIRIGESIFIFVRLHYYSAHHWSRK